MQQAALNPMNCRAIGAGGAGAAAEEDDTIIMEQLILHLLGDYVTQSDWMANDEAIERLETWRQGCLEQAADGDPRWRIGLVSSTLGPATAIDQNSGFALALDAVALDRAIHQLGAVDRVKEVLQRIINRPTNMGYEDIDDLGRIAELLGVDDDELPGVGDDAA